MRVHRVLSDWTMPPIATSRGSHQPSTGPPNAAEMAHGKLKKVAPQNQWAGRVTRARQGNDRILGHSSAEKCT